VLSGKNVISGFGSNSYVKALDKYIEKVSNKYQDLVNKYGADSDKAEKYKFKFLEKAIKEKDAYTKNTIQLANKKEQERIEKERAKTRAADAAKGAFKDTVQQDKGGGGTWKAQTAAKERQGQKVAGPGFGKGAYFEDGGRVYLYDRQEMADGGEAESYADIIDAYENGVGVLEGESLTDYIRRNRIKIMDPVEKANGGPISESDFPFLINRPGENTGRRKPGLSDYDKDTQDYDYYDDDIIEIPMGRMIKKKTKKKKKKKDREDYSDGGRVYLYDRQD
jgi:hypothetical protein